MMPWPAHPVVLEIFTWPWLTELGARYQRRRALTLAEVPDEIWDEVARPGIDAVWLMGVWERSPVGAQIARTTPAMRAAHAAALPGDLTDADVIGSAYCVRDYLVDHRLGGEPGLAAARAALARRGVRLVLDFVPNHVAPDHRWVHDHPEYFIQGTPADLARAPDAYLQIGARIFARGRDPYFPSWPEVLQLDASHAGLRAAMVDVVGALARRCDGLRCDMAMLVLDDVFARTWGREPADGSGFWPPIVRATKAAHPEFALWAEAYWDLEPRLVEQGFDACYDKRLYDRMVHALDVPAVRAHLAADASYQRHTLRFVENHDEPRAASLLSPAAHRAALAAVLTLPGVALLYEGEADGRRTHVPVTLRRRAVEPLDRALRADVERLLATVADIRRGTWALAPVRGWPDNASAERLLAWTWTTDARRTLVVVNLTDARADGRVELPWRGHVILDDRLRGDHHARELTDDGLYVALDAHAVHVFDVRARASDR